MLNPSTAPADSLAMPKPELLSAAQVQAIIGISKSTLWRMIQAGDFPRPMKLTKQLARWHRTEVDGWIKAKTAEPRHS